MTTREELIRVQWDILERIKEDIQQETGPIPRELLAYRERYRAIFDHYEAFSNKDELLTAIEQANIVYVGDYHTLKYAQDTNLRILREVTERRQDVILCMEMVHRRDQQAVDQYLAGQMEEFDFRQAIQYERNWGFIWENYLPFFEFAQEHNLPVLALNCDLSHNHRSVLEHRDECAAELIAQASIDNPSALVYVTFGDLHLAPEHIPGRVDALLKKQGLTRNRVVVYQNNEDLYWELVKRGREYDVHVVRIKEGAYAVQNTPPWVKLQSYLTWLEYGEEMLCKLYHFCPPDLEPDDPYSYDDQTYEAIRDIADLFELSGDFYDFNVYTLGDLSFRDEVKSFREIYSDRVFDQLILENRSIFFPEGKILYFSRLDMNHVIEEAAEYLYFQCAQYPVADPRTPEAFYRRILSRALGFLASKIINPERRLIRMADYQYHAENDPRPSILNQVAPDVLAEDEMVQSCLEQQKSFERRVIEVFAERDVDNLLLLSRAIGHILGDRLTRLFLNEEISKEELRQHFYNPLEKPADLFAAYLHLRQLTTKYLIEEYRLEAQL